MSMLSRVHMQMAHIMLAVAAGPNINQAVNVTLDLVVDLTAEVHGGSAWLFESVLIDPATAT